VKARTRLLGVDYGTRRVGLAVSDPDRLIASPLAVYTRGDQTQDLRYFQRLVANEEIGCIVLGLPVHTSGQEGQKAREARAFGQWLHRATGLPVVFWDERFTTVEAEQFMGEAGLTDKQRKARRDMIAAQILLQSYLEAGCPDSMQFGPLAGEPED
jgi:putative Holliday junction resolvase